MIFVNNLKGARSPPPPRTSHADPPPPPQSLSISTLIPTPPGIPRPNLVMTSRLNPCPNVQEPNLSFICHIDSTNLSWGHVFNPFVNNNHTRIRTVWWQPSLRQLQPLGLYLQHRLVPIPGTSNCYAWMCMWRGGGQGALEPRSLIFTVRNTATFLVR